jgi:hypothetical protein
MKLVVSPLAFFLSLSAVFVPAMNPVRAQGGSSSGEPSISLTPAVVMVKAKPGQTFSQDLTLYNNTTRELVFSMVASDVMVRNGQRTFVPAGEVDGSIAKTAVFTFPSVVVEPGQFGTTTVTVTIPPSPGPRAIACVFLGQTVVGTKNSVSMTGSLGALITFTLDDDFKVSSAPVQTVIDPELSSVVFHEQVQNVGTDPVVPTGVIAVTDDRGVLVARLPVPGERLLPGESRELTAEHAGLFKSGRYHVAFLMENQSAFFSSTGDFTIK